MGEYEFLQFPPESVRIQPDMFARLPASARRVLLALRDHGPMTHASLRDATGMPARTIRFAVHRLKEDGFIETRSSLRDCRTCYFFVSRQWVGEDALADARRRAEEAARDGLKVIEQA